MRPLKPESKSMSLKVLAASNSLTGTRLVRERKVAYSGDVTTRPAEGLPWSKLSDDICTGQMVIRSQTPVLRRFHRFRVIRELHLLRKTPCFLGK
jgi:hypothetical protein